MTQEMKKYELSYLLSPSIALEDVDAKLGAIRTMIEKHEGAFLGEDAPRLKPLAYEIRKSIANKIARFTQAYMGSLYFTAPSLALPEIAKALAGNDLIVRYLLVEYHATPESLEVRSEEVSSLETPAEVSGEPVAEVPAESKEQLDQKIDAEIDNLIASNS